MNSIILKRRNYTTEPQRSPNGLIVNKISLMLEYFKIILSKVSFDPGIFEKELRKAMQTLIEEELTHLKEWCFSQFSEHQLILDNCFNNSQANGYVPIRPSDK